MNIWKSGIPWFLLRSAVLLVWLCFLPSCRPQSGSELGNFSIQHDYEVVKIQFSRKAESTLSLTLAADGAWSLNDTLGANDAAVREVLGALRQFAVRMPVPMVHRDSILQQIGEEGLLVEIFARRHLLRFSENIRLLPLTRRVNRFWVGPDNKDMLGTYMKDYRLDIPVIVHVPGKEGGVADLFETHERIWRNPVVLNLSPDQIAHIGVKIHGYPLESFDLEITEDGFVLKGAQEISKNVAVDTARVQRFIKSFTELYYRNLLDVHTDAPVLELKAEEPFFEIRVRDTFGKITHLRFYRKVVRHAEQYTDTIQNQFDPNEFILNINQREWALANYFVFNRIIRNHSFFLTQRSH